MQGLKVTSLVLNLFAIYMYSNNDKYSLNFVSIPLSQTSNHIVVDRIRVLEQELKKSIILN